MSLLVTEPTIKAAPSRYRKNSAVKSPVISLANYLSEVTFPIDGQKHTKFALVKAMKADPEDLAEYPSIGIYPEGEVQYGAEDGVFDKQVVHDEEGEFALLLAGDLRIDLSLHVWTNDEGVREQALTCLEDALNPVEWMPGFMLEMPHYYGQRAEYQLLTVAYEDIQADNERRYKKLNARVRATCPYVRGVVLPRFNPKTIVEVVASGLNFQSE